MRSTLIFLFSVLFFQFSQAQKQEITGTIVAFNKYPVKNVTVLARKAKTEVLTDDQGKFTIEVEKKDVLQIDAKTFERFIYRIGESEKSPRINLIYLDKKKNFDVAVTEGYMSREDLDYGRTNLAAENNVFGNYTDVFEAIRYAIPSASFSMEDGVQKVILRGTKSLEGSSAALYAVNGFLTEDISYIMPSSIVSIQQLTGPAAGRYGTGSGNGVIAITTR